MGEIYTPIPHFHFCVGTKNFFPPDAENFPSRRRRFCVGRENRGNDAFVKIIRKEQM